MVTKNFVTFYSPGTFYAETTTKPIDGWDVEAAKTMANDIVERYNATPYGFRFSTRGRDDDELDSKVIASSGMYYISGNVLTLEEVKARNDPKDKIIISNMEYNNWNRIIESTKGWRWTLPLSDNDVVLTD